MCVCVSSGVGWGGGGVRERERERERGHFPDSVSRTALCSKDSTVPDPLLDKNPARTVVVCWLLNVPATCECISWTDLLRQCCVLPH